jgi:AmiR/NasT family two-component response regulator
MVDAPARTTSLLEQARRAQRESAALQSRTLQTLADVAETIAAMQRGDTPSRVDDLIAEVQGLRRAMEHRAEIEQAKGIIMANMRCGSDEAFDVLRRQSQHENRRLNEIAHEIVAVTSRPPDAPRR